MRTPTSRFLSAGSCCTPLLQPVGQRLALQALHDQEVHVAVPAHVMERADMGMVQAGDGLGLALEPLLPLGVRLGNRAHRISILP